MRNIKQPKEKEARKVASNEPDKLIQNADQIESKTKVASTLPSTQESITKTKKSKVDSTSPKRERARKAKERKPSERGDVDHSSTVMITNPVV